MPSIKRVDPIYANEPRRLVRHPGLLQAVLEKHATESLALQRRVYAKRRKIPCLAPTLGVQDAGLDLVHDTHVGAGVGLDARERKGPRVQAVERSHNGGDPGVWGLVSTSIGNNQALTYTARPSARRTIVGQAADATRRRRQAGCLGYRQRLR